MAMVLLRTTAPVTVGAHVPAGGVDAWNEALGSFGCSCALILQLNGCLHGNGV